MGSSRRMRDAKLAAYELPAFAAGKTKARMERVLALAQAIQEEAQAAQDEAAEWQRREAERVNYPYRRSA